MSARRRHRSSSRGPTSITWFGVLAMTIVLGIAALTVVKKGMKLQEQRDRSREEARVQARSGGAQPFAGMRREQAPDSAGGGASAPAPFGGAKALAAHTDDVWERAQVLAEEADDLYDACVKAKRNGRMESMNLKGRRARSKYDEALELTAAWEERLVELHGDSDPGVREIMRVRDAWFDRVRWLHKSVAR